jgi:type I restriction enzyme S subunit
MTWQTKELGDICTLYQGIAINAKTKHCLVEKSELPLLRIKDLKNNTAEKFVDPSNFPKNALVNEDDIIYTRTGSLGLVFRGKKGVLHNNSFKVKPSHEVSNDYLYLWLQNQDFREKIISLASRAAQPDITHALFKKEKISFPPLETQKQIVAKLDQAFADIEKVKMNAKQNLKNAKELFDSYLDSFSQEKKALGDFVEIKTGKLNSNAAKENGKYPFFTCSREIFAIDEYAFDCESILLAGNNASGDFNVKHYNGKFNAYQRTYVITIKDLQMLNYGFLYYQMVKSLRELKSSSVGAGTKFLKLGMIKDLKISIPDIDVQNKALSKLSQLEKNVKSLEVVYQKKINALDELKQSILQKAFNGELA